MIIQKLSDGVWECKGEAGGHMFFQLGNSALEALEKCFRDIFRLERLTQK